MNNKMIDVVVEPHGRRRPHQHQDLVIRDHVPDLSDQFPGLDVTELKEKIKTINLEISRTVVDKLKGQPITTDLIKKTIGDILATKGYKYEPKNSSRWCDIPDCTMCDNVLVARALSPEFNVDTKKCQLSSRIVLAEVLISDYETKEEAIEAARFLVRKQENLTLDMLHKIKRPKEHGYSEEQVFDAMYPFIINLARRYSTKRFPEEDGIQQGFFGIRQAMNTDRAVAPFSSHSFRHIQTMIRRKSATSAGLISHGERDANFHGNMGVLIGWDSEGEPMYNTIQSADVVVGEDQISLYDLADQNSQMLNKVDPNPEPIDIITRNEDMSNAKKRVISLFKEARLTPQQHTVACLYYALVGYIDNPYNGKNPYKEQAKEHKKWEDNHKEFSERWINGDWSHIGTEIAFAMGCSRQRVGQQIIKYQDKLLRAAAKIAAHTEKEANKKAKAKAKKSINPSMISNIITKLHDEKPVWNGKKFINK